jgi:hypothetical protein
MSRLLLALLALLPLACASATRGASDPQAEPALPARAPTSLVPLHLGVEAPATEGASAAELQASALEALAGAFARATDARVAGIDLFLRWSVAVREDGGLAVAGTLLDEDGAVAHAFELGIEPGASPGALGAALVRELEPAGERALAALAPLSLDRASLAVEPLPAGAVRLRGVLLLPASARVSRVRAVSAVVAGTRVEGTLGREELRGGGELAERAVPFEVALPSPRAGEEGAAWVALECLAGSRSLVSRRFTLRLAPAPGRFP